MCCVQGIDVFWGGVFLSCELPMHVSPVIVANSFKEVNSSLFCHEMQLPSGFSSIHDFKNEWRPKTIIWFHVL